MGFSLDRAQEMLVGVMVPLVILGIFELILPPGTARETFNHQPKPASDTPSDPQNQLALKVMGVTLIITGVMIIGLGVLASESRGIVIATGLVVVAPGIFLLRRYQGQVNR
jgi:hypothetical protein